MTLNNRYPGVKDVGQIEPFQSCPDLPSPMNVLLFAFEKKNIDLATACRLFEMKFNQTSSLKAYCKVLTQDPEEIVLQAFFTEIKEIKKILKDALEQKYISIGFTGRNIVKANVYCPVSNKPTYAVNTFQGLPLNIPEDTKKKVTEAVKLDIIKKPELYSPIKVEDYIIDILLDTTFDQGCVVLSRYYSGKMTLITQHGYLLNTKCATSLYLYGREYYYCRKASHHLYCRICKALDFHDTICCPKDC